MTKQQETASPFLPLTVRLNTTALTAASIVPLLLISSHTNAQPEKILIGTDAWPPFRFVTQNNISGIDDDLWQKLSQAMNFKIEYIRCPWKRCLDMMRSGQIDAMSGLAWREARAVYIEYTNPAYYRCSPRFYLRRGEEHILKNQQDLSRLNIGMVRGSAYYPDFDSNDTLQKTQMTQEHVLLQLLAAQRIDTYIGTDCQADYELTHSQWKQSFIKAPFTPDSHTPLYIGLSKNPAWRSELERLNSNIEKVLQQGFQNEIEQKYYR
ncbi:substrate-binding periplasmic protein [Oceanospirillum beijerinckii]|uniref:substrate-binding periplasmic protein n=1 Tax=Oceanospirillum beijerinckii TaxID=64976 RepID=UPI000412D821|nr:transporter substrate-binding domain-containing protein [Oceanospirillum beijerinckii]